MRVRPVGVFNKSIGCIFGVFVVLALRKKLVFMLCLFLFDGCSCVSACVSSSE